MIAPETDPTSPPPPPPASDADAEAFYDVIIIGGGHAGAEAAWAAANMLSDAFPAGENTQKTTGRVALISMDLAKVGTMSCNPAIGGLAKGQMVREIDALGGIMGLVADATGIQFKVLNQSKGPAVHGPRCQSDKYAYAQEVQRLLKTRPNLHLIQATVDGISTQTHAESEPQRGEGSGIPTTPTPPTATGVLLGGSPFRYANPQSTQQIDAALNARQTQHLGMDCCGSEFNDPAPDAINQTNAETIPVPNTLHAKAVILTTGTFMRGLMHTGESQTPGGRVGEAPAVGMSQTLRDLGFELGRLKTGTPPRLAAESIDFDDSNVELAPGDTTPTPFSDMTLTGAPGEHYTKVAHQFPMLKQVDCWTTHTNAHIHSHIKDNIDRAPMYNGQIETAGPRYCPSIEDKVVRFADKSSHHVFLEPESLNTNEIYCNGISTSLPADVQDIIIHNLPGCEKAEVLKYGYAVEYDMVRPNQIDATTMTKRVQGLFLAGQINGTSGYEEAAGQGLLAGINAVRHLRDENLIRFDRDQAYLGVLMDDLVTKIPVEPYRMFTSRAEYRLLLRADNAAERLTPFAHALGLIDAPRWQHYQQRQLAKQAVKDYLDSTRDPNDNSKTLSHWIKRPNVTVKDLLDQLNNDPAANDLPELARHPGLLTHVLAESQYAGYIDRHHREIAKLAESEHAELPLNFDYTTVKGLRTEAALTLNQFQPATLGQAQRLAGVNPADLMLLTVALKKTTVSN